MTALDSLLVVGDRVLVGPDTDAELGGEPFLIVAHGAILALVRPQHPEDAGAL